MKETIEERACALAVYMIENKATVRATAQRFGISKSTVHKDLSERLPAFNRGAVFTGGGDYGTKQGRAAHPRRDRNPEEV